MSKGPPQSQRAFLLDAMTRLGMSREAFAVRIGTKKKTVDNWLAMPESTEYRNMPDMAWKFIREILENFKESA